MQLSSQNNTDISRIPDGRQTRIDFFNQGQSGSTGRHILYSQKGAPEWWQAFTGIFKTSKKDLSDPSKFQDFLTARKYSEKTIRSYLFMMKNFFGYMKANNAREITPGLIEDYNYDFFVSASYSRSYQLQFINAMTLYLESAHGIHVNLKGLRKSTSKR